LNVTFDQIWQKIDHVIAELYSRMEILIIGNNDQFEETKRKFGPEFFYTRSEERKVVPLQTDVVFDFLTEESTDLSVYENYAAILFLNSVFTTLQALQVRRLPCSVFGFCGLPGFVDRTILEVTLTDEQQNEFLLSACGRLNTEYRVVADVVGMVTPRVITMIINEAFRAVEEGIATREDIDKAMKLGTNYPYGPFEWCERIGTGNIHRLLNATLKSTGDTRYTASELLARNA
jgi:3-hydroxybutyryl-CoA dehydrogenase